MKKVINIIVVISLLFGFIPNVNAAANTLGELKVELANLKKKQSDNYYSKKRTEGEINNQKLKIINANNQIRQAENDIEVAKNKINEINKKIDSTKNETKELLVFYQKIVETNATLEFMTGSENVAEMVLRRDATVKIIDYNKEKLKTLEELIDENEKLQIELAQKEVELERSIGIYEKSIEGLESDLSSLSKVSIDIQDQIKAQQELINYYESLGCKDDQMLKACLADVANNANWLRPTTKGLISSGFGYRSFYLNGRPYSDFHPGSDVAGIPAQSPVYAVASGTVAATIYKARCGGNQVLLHVRVRGAAYTVQYAHLASINVRVGQQVTNQDIIGTLGGGGFTLLRNGGWDNCSTGWHLHFGIAKGFYLGYGPDGYSNYNTFISKSIQPPMMPAWQQWYYTRY